MAKYPLQKLKGNQVKILDSTRCCKHLILAYKLKSFFVSILVTVPPCGTGRPNKNDASQKTCQ
jgi:hypothetical protein